jgi:hypothetical protein
VVAAQHSAPSPSFLWGLQESALLLGAGAFKASELAMTAYGLARLGCPVSAAAADDETGYGGGSALGGVDPAFLHCWGQALWARLAADGQQWRPRELVVVLDSLVRLGYRCVVGSFCVRLHHRSLD